MEFLTLSAESLADDSHRLAQRIAPTFQPDLVVFVAKAGYLIGKALSEAFSSSLLGAEAHRRGNRLKALLSPLLLRLPKGIKNRLRAMELSSGTHEKNPERHLSFHRPLSLFTPERILVVDDSVDTGHSVKAVSDALRAAYPHAEIKTAALNAFAKSEEVMPVDFCLYRDTVLLSPMSKDSREHKAFLAAYEQYLSSLNAAAEQEVVF